MIGNMVISFVVVLLEIQKIFYGYSIVKGFKEEDVSI